MLKRAVTGAVLLLVLAGMIFFAPVWGFSLFTGVLAALAVWELQGAVAPRRNGYLLAVSCVFALFFPLVLTQAPAYSMIFLLGFFLLTYGIYLFLYDRDVSVLQLFTAAGMTVLLTLAFASMALIRCAPQGIRLVITVFMGAWLSDTFAYLVGTLFGKHKLCPRMSPKKSIEGAVGAVLFTAAAFVLYECLILKGGRLWFAALGGGLCSLLAQMGDLNASCLKRKMEIKDFGTVLPGHGGILDRFDSVLLTAPALYVFYSLTGII